MGYLYVQHQPCKYHKDAKNYLNSLVNLFFYFRQNAYKHQVTKMVIKHKVGSCKHDLKKNTENVIALLI